MRSIRMLAKKIPGVDLTYQAIRRTYAAWKLQRLGVEGVFAEIHQRNHWGSAESVSGEGSTWRETRRVAEQLPGLLRDLGVKSMLDLPCGDFHWMSGINLQGVRYLGGDVVTELVSRNQAQYAGPNIAFQKLNLLTDPLPQVDLIHCRDCLVHFSHQDVLRALQNICASNSTYLLTTTFPGQQRHRDIATGQWRMLNLQLPPFGLPAPLHSILEESSEADGACKDKSLALWRIADLRQSCALAA